MFYSLHSHTYASNIRFLDSINRPSEMIKKAIRLGFGGIAFTDHEALSAAVEIIKERDKIKKDHPEFKIIFGNEIYLIDESEIKNTSKYYHFILLAKDKEGWDQLRELSSFAWENSYVEKGQVRVPTTYQKMEEVIGKNPGHVFASTACIGGRLPFLILEHDVPGANSFIKWCIKTFGNDNFALELQPSDNEEQVIVNKTLIKLARHYNLPFIVTTDSHYLDKEDFKIHSAFLNSKQTSDRETEKFYKYTYIMTEQEMIDILTLDGHGISVDEAKEAINNTAIIGEQIQEYDFRHGTIVPKIRIPEFHITRELYGDKKYPITNKFYDSDDEQDRYLMYQIEQGIHDKKIIMDDIKRERIEKELDILDYISERLNQKLSAYLNLTVNIINLAWQASLVAPGRGSSTGFYINYLIGITQIDPFVYGLKEWRFLNKERVELPDVDSDFQPEKTAEIIRILREEYGEDHVLNCATFKTESLKSAILSCGRGLGYNNDDMQALAAMVPAHRGHTYTLKECLEGDEEKGFEPVKDFEAKLKSYDGLFEAVQKIEGLPTNASIHASALYVFNDGYLPQNSLMRAPNKTKMTAFSMHDSDDMGALKMDVLRTDAQSKIAKCMDLLLKDGEIEWQGTLRKTYNKYLHPDFLEYNNPVMWEKMSDGSIPNLFQMDSPVGAIAMKKARPENVRQLAEVNSIMRLQSESGEQPIDRYVRFRNDINQWYLEMADAGLNQHEIQIMEKYLKDSNGVSGSQEVLMQILMDPEICSFTLGEANAARKAIAKKIAAKIIQLKKDFFEKGSTCKTREEFLNYVWVYCIEPQLGYSFSINHTVPYSVVAVQEANLATRWNPLYWQCACLCVNSGNYVGEIGEDEEEEEDEEIQEEVVVEEEQKTKKVAPNYGKISKAICDMQTAGVKIELPDINKAQADFIPDIENNAIYYSLQAVTVVSDDLFENIIKNRPYKGVLDFYSRVKPTTAQMIGLIKAGCFDKLSTKNRMYIMYRFLDYLATQEIPLKNKLTTVQLKKALSLQMPELNPYSEAIRVYKYRVYLEAKCLSKAEKRYLINDETCINFFNTYIKDKMYIEKGEYSYLPNNVIAIKVAPLKRVVDETIKPLMDWLNSSEGATAYTDLLRKEFIEDLKEKYCKGSLSAWEMETMNFYYSGYELEKMNDYMYGVQNFNTLPETPSGKCSAIAGTIINVVNGKHTISLLTKYGVVDVKFYKDAYNKYNQKISEVDGKTKKKIVIDDSWFKRGNKVLVYGTRREDTFVAKNCKIDTYYRCVGLIENVNMDGSLEIRFTRNKKRM